MSAATGSFRALESAPFAAPSAAEDEAGEDAKLVDISEQPETDGQAFEEAEACGPDAGTAAQPLKENSAFPVLTPTVAFTPQPEPTFTPELAASPEPSPSDAPEDGSPAQDEPIVVDMERTEGYVYAKSANLRAGPGLNYDILREYSQYRALTITGKSGEWYRIEIGGNEGFMLREFVKKGSPDLPTPTPKATPRSEKTPKATQKPEPTKTPKPAQTAEPAQTPRPTPHPAGDSVLNEEQYLVAQLLMEESGPDGLRRSRA